MIHLRHEYAMILQEEDIYFWLGTDFLSLFVNNGWVFGQLFS